MYQGFFGLKRLPFDVSPDPDFVFPSDKYKEALSAVVCGVEMGKGLIAVTGEVGLGKTTLLRAFLAQIDRNRFQVIYVFHPGLSFEDLLSLIASELGAEPAPPERSALLHVQETLIAQYTATRRRVIIVIDEAQRLRATTLEHLRLLTNLETTTEKLIEIVLLGQPELERTLALPEMRQLNQRIAFRARLAPLTYREGLFYVRHRLAVAGASAPETVLNKGAVSELLLATRGVPRLINIVADNALIAGYAAGKRPIGARQMRKVIREQRRLGLAPLRKGLACRLARLARMAADWLHHPADPSMRKATSVEERKPAAEAPRGRVARTSQRRPAAQRHK